MELEFTEDDCFEEDTKTGLEQILAISDFIVFDYGIMVDSKDLRVGDGHRGWYLMFPDGCYSWAYNLKGYYIKKY